MVDFLGKTGKGCPDVFRPHVFEDKRTYRLQFEIQDYKCLDLFAGTGALGIEAISRGAEKTVFIESNKKNYLSIKNSISELNLKNYSMVLFKDGLNWIKENDLSMFDLILLDPPFNKNLSLIHI